MHLDFCARDARKRIFQQEAQAKRMDTKLKLDGDSVKQLAEILNETGLSEIEYEDQGCRIRVVKSSTPVMMHATALPSSGMVSAPAPIAPAPVDAPPPVSGHPLRSPMVGTAYFSSEPGAAPFVKVGDHVKEGQTLLIIEAMKVMNPIKATRSGIVRTISVSDASPVEFDEVLMVIE